MPDVKPSAFVNAAPTSETADFIPYTKDKTGTPLDRTMSLRELFTALNLLTTIIDIDSDSGDYIAVYQANGSVAKKISVDNYFKGKYIIPIPVSALFRRTTTGTSEDLNQEEMPTNKINFKKFSFDAATDEFIQIAVPMPDTWDGGTIEVRFYWKANATSGTVRWAVAGRSYGDGETLDQAMGSTQEVEDTVTATANQLLISAWTSPITLAGTPAPGELVILEISRNADHANDTLTVDAALLAIEVRVTVNKKADA